MATGAEPESVSAAQAKPYRSTLRATAPPFVPAGKAAAESTPTFKTFSEYADTTRDSRA